MTAILLPNGKQQYFTTAGLPAVGYKVATFAAGTSTPQTTWQDALKVAPQTNPIILDGRGEASIFWDGAYKVQLQDSTGAVIWTQDGLQSQQNSFSATLVPATTNTTDVGTSILSWRTGYFATNVLLGPNNTPAFDSASGNIGYYARTTAEIAAGVTPTSYVYPFGHASRYGAVGDGVTDDSNAVQTVLTLSVGYQALTRTTAQRNTPAGYFPNGAYLVTRPLTIPNAASIHCENDAWFFYNDTVTPGSYLFTWGAAGGGVSGLGWDRLRINLLTTTGKGLNILNAQDYDIDDYYCQGLVLANWASNIAGMTARSNVGLRIEATAGQQGFWGRFGNIHLNHCHTGILIPDSGGFVGQHEIRFLNLFGDATFNDQGAKGVDAVAGQDVIVHGGYIESYYNAAGVAGIKLATTKCVRWKVSKVVFDVGGSPSGIMIGIAFAGPGAPQSNQFLGCTIDPATITVADGSVCTDGNLIENNPNISPTWTAQLVPSTSGTITLTSGLAGNQCFCIKRGNEVHIWGYLNVTSVSAPVGRLFLQGLPFTAANNNANQMPVTLRADGGNATAATMLQGYVNRNSTQIEIEHFAAGSAGGAAADVKAAMNIYFDCTYITVSG